MESHLVSVIVPTKDSSRTLAACLASARNQSHKEIELIIVDNNSSDNTVEIARLYADKVLNKGPERSAQRNHGVENCKGSFLLFPDSDMVLSSEVVKSCVDAVKANPDVKALVIPEESFGTGFWARCKKLERQFYVGVEWMEAARFFDRGAFQKMGGYDERNTGTEDFDLPQRIEAHYGPGSISRVGEFIYHDEGELDLLDSLRKKYYYGHNLDRYRSIEANTENFQKQLNILKRYQLFLSHPSDLLDEPLVSLGMLFMKFCDHLAWGLGLLVSKAGGLIS